MTLRTWAISAGLAATLASAACSSPLLTTVQVESIRVPGAVIACSGRPTTPEECLVLGEATVGRAESPGLPISRVEITFSFDAGACQRMNVEVLTGTGITISSATGPCPSN